ncbi:MAG: sensor histidine kinase [Candidatus Binatia bacterium]
MSNPQSKRRGDFKLSIDPFDDSNENNRWLSDEFPCVFYQADEFLKVIRVSGNVHDLIGIQREQLIGVSWLFKEAVVPADRASLQLKLAELDNRGVTSLIHRLVDDSGRIVRVAHSLRRVIIDGQPTIRGNLLPLIACDAGGTAVNVELVYKFIHKIGNHFQLLNLMLDSMRHKSAMLNDLELVQETTENAIELTQMFSSYLEQPQLSTNVNLSELMETVVESRASSRRAKQIEIAFSDDGIAADATIYGDGAFLDLALGAVLDNAINASPTGGVILIAFLAPPEIPVNGIVRTIVVRVKDNGSGIPADQIERILEPFHPMRPRHDGIALSLACRYIEMHGGLSQIHSCEGKGTDFEITFPIVPLLSSANLRKCST